VGVGACAPGHDVFDEAEEAEAEEAEAEDAEVDE
jgi:hypothetical protein